jgi:DNA-binding GntR family transcriptional regulator
MPYRYLEIARELRNRIAGGEFPPGSRLPGINAIARQYGVGNDVAQEAYTALELDGLVVTRAGSGTYVLDPGTRQRLDIGRQVRRNELGYLFSRPSGHWHPIGTPSRQWVPCPPDVADLLTVDSGTEVLARYRVVGPGQPVQITTTYLPADLARGTVLEQADTGPGGYLDRLEQDMGHGPLTWAADVSARLPTTEEAAALGVSARLPVLVAHRTHTSVHSRTVAVDVVVVDARQFSVRFPIGRHSSARWPTPPGHGPEPAAR